MPDSHAIEAERALQPAFRKRPLLQGLVLAALILLFHLWVRAQPDRVESGPRIAELRFAPVALDPRGFAPLRLAGAWQVTSSDPRFGGISALAIDGGMLVALSDSGVLAEFAKPGRGQAAALVRELPGGPGDPRFKQRRDSEALARDPAGRGWWVAFENGNALWLYDRQFARALGSVDFGRARWPLNRGIEGVAADGRGLLLFPERGDAVVRLVGAKARTLPLEHTSSRISDAVRLPTGRLIAVERRFSARGFTNGLALIEESGSGYRIAARIPLGVGPLDNVEALAAEELPGGVRLWLMTDDNLQPPLRTLLIALDWPLRRPARTPSSKSRA